MEAIQSILCRRSVRAFSDKTISREVLLELLHCAQRAPSGFNVQPWNFLVVQSKELKEKLYRIALEQNQVREAPAVLVVIADPLAWKEKYSKVLELSKQEGTLSPEAIRRYQKLIPFYFSPGLLGEYYLLKRFLIAMRRLIKPTSKLPYSSAAVRAYMREHTMLAAQNYMIAAHAKGLGTVPMQGFDEVALKKLLDIQSSMTVPIIIPTGYEKEGLEQKPPSVRIPLEEIVSWDQYKGNGRY